MLNRLIQFYMGGVAVISSEVCSGMLGGWLAMAHYLL